jgi:hypothetical protein
MGLVDKTLGHIEPGQEGLMGRAVEGLEYFGLSYAAGYAQNRWRQKASLFGAPADFLVGLGGKIASVALDHWGGHRHRHLVSHANVLGNVGLGAFGHTLGAGAGAQASGVKRVLVDAKDVDKIKKLVPGSTVLGEIPKAPHGDLLSTRELQEMAR